MIRSSLQTATLYFYVHKTETFNVSFLLLSLSVSLYGYIINHAGTDLVEK